MSFLTPIHAYGYYKNDLFNQQTEKITFKTQLKNILQNAFDLIQNNRHNSILSATF